MKQNLELNRDYRGVNRDVWSIFYRMYGGGPTIIREELNIYSKDVSKEIEKKKREARSKEGNIFATAKS